MLQCVACRRILHERKLYDAVQTLLDEHDVVLYESIKPAGTGGAGGRNEQQRIQSTRAAMGFVAAVLGAHHRGRQKYPDDLEELVEFAAGREPRMGEWLVAARMDAWGGELTYEVQEEGQRFALGSLGADGRPGGEGESADLHLGSDASIAPVALERGGDNLQAELAKALGLEFQLDAIDYERPHFRSSDLALDQLERSLRAKDVDLAPIAGSLTGSTLPGKLAIFLLRLVRAADIFLEGAIADALKVVLIELLSDEAMIEQSLKQFGPGFEAVIIDERNQLVIDDLKAILEREPQVSSIAILYGAGHMPDMARRLTEQLGYRPTGEQWLTAFEVDLEQSAMSARQLEQIRRMVRYQLEQLKSQQNPES